MTLPVPINKIRSLLLKTQAVVEISLGALPLLLPTVLPTILGSTLTEKEGLLLSRLVGATLISIGFLSWQVRHMETSVISQAILRAFLIFQVFAFFILLHGQINGVRGPLGWLFVGGHFLFAIGFIYLEFHKTD